MTNKIETQFWCRLLQEGCRPWVRSYWWKFRRIPWLDSKDSRYRDCISTIFLLSPLVFGLEIKIQKSSGVLCSDFPSDAMLWIKEVEMVDSLDALKSLWSIAGKNFPNFEMLDAKIASSLNKIIQNSQFKKKVSLEEQKAHKEDRFPRGRQIALWSTTTFELLALVIQYWTTLIYSLSLFMMIMFRTSIRDGMKFYYQCQRFHPMISCKVCANW